MTTTISNPIDRPIFIVGPHRSGSTLLYRRFGKHPDIGFPNLANRRVSFSPRLAHLLGKLAPGMTFLPMESQRFWDRHRPRDDDVMDEKDATPKVVRWYVSRIAPLLSLRGTPRFLAKYPRLSLRLPWLEAVFPGAMFIHTIRDWRAVVSSTIERMKKRTNREKSWFGLRLPGWRDMQDLPPPELAGRMYVAAMRQLDLQRERLGDRCLNVHYEEFCRAPSATIGKIVAWAGLEPHPRTDKNLPDEFEVMNWKWKEQLSPETIEEVRALDPELFGRFETDAAD